jgi:Phosphotransferase enzyme family
MHLTAANLAHFLMGRGLLSADAIVASDVLVLDSSRRNRNFKAIQSRGPSLFVKQMREMQADAMLTLRREAACYQFARNDPALSRLMPRLIRYDANWHVLIIELLPNAESLSDYHARHKAFPPEIGRMLGEGLGIYHAHADVLLKSKELKALFARQVPVILRLERGGHAALGHFGRIGPALSALIQQHQEFQTLLDALGAEWRFDSLIHGDMRWDNVLVFPAQGGLDFRVVDWEMADFGDAAWDVGAVLQSFLAVWIQSMPIASGLPPEAYISMATQPLETMRPVLGTFWEAYARTRGFGEDQRKHELERCMRFGAARLVWAAVEQRLYAPQLDPAAAALLQVSLNVLKDPARAVKDLLEL